jgi:hypothetical protein
MFHEGIKAACYNYVQTFSAGIPDALDSVANKDKDAHDLFNKITNSKNAIAASKLGEYVSYIFKEAGVSEYLTRYIQDYVYAPSTKLGT